jgi:hypothetical protein
MSSFKTLLLKKAECINSELRDYVANTSISDIYDIAYELLEKMAGVNKKNTKISPQALHVGQTYNDSIGNMVYDALSHHASHYKDALDKGDQDRANEHAKKIFKIIKHSNKLESTVADNEMGQKFKVDAPNPAPWERNHPTYATKDENGKYKNDTRQWDTTTKDFNWLNAPPATDTPNYAKQVANHGHSGPYPLEHIKVNGRYLDVKPVDEPERPTLAGKPTKHNEASVAAHLADKYPLFDPEFIQKHPDFHASPEFKDWRKSFRDKSPEDASRYEQRKIVPGSPAHSPKKEPTQ